MHGSERLRLGAAAAVFVLSGSFVGSAHPREAGGPTCGGVEATIIGTNGNDTLRGTWGRDVIVGKRGADSIRGLGGKIFCAAAAGATS